MSQQPGTRVIGYCRVSHEDQVREGVSLDAQEARVLAYCEARGWVVVDLIRDEGRSAKDLRRPGLQRILAGLPRRQRAWNAIVVVKIDRLTRSVKDLAVLMDAFKRARVGFTAIQEAVDTTSASGELFLNIIGALSQWERRAIGERTAAALHHLRARGRRVSRLAPFGYRFKGGRVVSEPQEQRTIEAILRLASTGPSLRRLAIQLARDGHVSRTGRPFSPASLHRIVSKGAVGNRQQAVGGA